MNNGTKNAALNEEVMLLLSRALKAVAAVQATRLSRTLESRPVCCISASKTL